MHITFWTLRKRAIIYTSEDLGLSQVQKQFLEYDPANKEAQSSMMYGSRGLKYAVPPD
jgi:hypothetical protein